MRKFFTVLALSLVATIATFGQHALKPGEDAPVFASQSLDGTTYDLNQLKGKIVVLTFWTTRCAVCHSEIPHLNRMASRYRENDDVVFLAPTVDNETTINRYISRYPFNFQILPNSFGVVLKYADRDRFGNVNIGFPAYFLINRNGAIVMRTYGWDKAANIDQQISRLLTTY